MQKRFIIFLVFSAAIFLAWQLAIEKLYPNAGKNAQQKTVSTETPPPPGSMTPPAQADGSTTASVAHSGAAATTASQPPAPATTVAPRQIRIRTDFWDGVVSNKGGVLTQWIMTRFTDGKPIDAPNGVSLVSERLGEFGFP